MSTPVLILGDSGTGKSRSMLNLNHDTNVLLNVLDKPLPFKGWKTQYKKLDSKTNTGNMLNSDDWATILKFLNYVSLSKPEAKTIVIDDFQYIMANEFMRRSSEKGYDKFNDIGTHAWHILSQIRLLREDLVVFVLSHSELDEYGTSRCKTIGKMLNDKICIEGMFSIVLNTNVVDGKYCFQTQNSGSNTSKSPEGMFSSLNIDNDLSLVYDAIKEYEK